VDGGVFTPKEEEKIMFTQVVLIGRIGQEPEVRMTQSGTPILTFRVAVDRWVGSATAGHRETDWHNVVVFGQYGERRSKDLHKGDLIVVTGELRIRKYRDNQGIDRMIHEIAGRTIRVLARSKAGASGSTPEAVPGTGPEVSLEEEFPVQDLSQIPSLPEDEDFEDEVG
jgi:single-strand DNA-binding protein